MSTGLRRSVRRLAAIGLGAVLAVLVTLSVAPPAGAHTAFESSDPADGAVVDGPVDSITVTFTGASTPAGDGFVVRLPNGEIVAPVVEVSDDSRAFVLRFEPAVADGTVAVRWSVRAGDAHPIHGAFSFAVLATTSPPPAPDATPTPTSGPAPSPTTGITATNPPADVEAEPSATPIPPAIASTPIDDDGADLETFLSTDQPRGPGAEAVGRGVAMLASLLLAGAVLFQIGCLRPLGIGRGPLVPIVAISGLLLLAGAAIQAATGDAPILAPLALQAIAGAAAFAGALLSLTGPTPSRAIRSAPAVGATVLAGAAAAGAASWLFDGHSLTEGNRLITAIVDLAHVSASGAWIGGLACLVWLWVRPGQPMAAIVARFSVVAAVAVAIAGVAGVGLAATILDTPGDLWGTEWGRLLLAKVALVAATALAGAWNHFVLVPRIERAPHDPTNLRHLRRSVLGELGLLIVVVALTAVLVAADTNPLG